MAKRLVITQPNTGKLWLLDPDIPQITEFDPQPPSSPSQLWADDTGRIIAWGGGQHMHYDPGTGLWTSLGSISQVWDYDGADYSNVWAISGDANEVEHFDGASWTQDTVLSSNRMLQVSVCGTGLDEVFVAALNHVWFRTGGAIGSGVWVDRRAQLLTDTGIDISASVPDCEGVWAVSKNEVYWLINQGNNSFGHWIVKWNGSGFSIVSSTSVRSYGVSDTSFDAVSSSQMFWMQADPSWGQYRFMLFNGTNIVRQTVEHNMPNGCKLIAETASQWWAVGRYSSPNRIAVWQGDGSQNGWTLFHTHTVGTSVTGDAGVALWESSFPPEVQNQNPAPGSTGNRGDGPIYLEVVDADNNLDASTVRITVNGQLAWSGGSAAPGWSGTRVVVTRGYGYTFTPDNPLPVGTVTVGVYAEDAEGNILDTSYTFEVGTFVDSVEGDLTERGGHQLTLNGLFAVDVGLEITLAGRPCYGGANKRYSPSSDDGVTVEFASPPLSEAGYKTLEVTGPGVSASFQMTVFERTWNQTELETRRNHPPWAALGARRLEDEDLISGPEITEELEMPSPRVEYNDPSTVDVELPFGALGQPVTYKLQDGQTYQFLGGESCDLDSGGVNGLDTGTKANNTWYHLYLVVSGGVLKPIFSANDPGTGPDGHSNYLPIMLVFNGNGGAIAPFDVDGAWVRYRNLRDMPLLWVLVAASPSTSSWLTTDLSDSSGWVYAPGYTLSPENFPGMDMTVVDAIYLTGCLDEDSGSSILFVRGGTTTPTEDPYEQAGPGLYLNGNEFASAHGAHAVNSTRKIAVPDGNLYMWFDDDSDNLDLVLRVAAFRHKYRW